MIGPAELPRLTPLVPVDPWALRDYEDAGAVFLSPRTELPRVVSLLAWAAQQARVEYLLVEQLAVHPLRTTADPDLEVGDSRFPADLFG